MGFWEFTIGDAAGIGLSVAGFGVAGWQLWKTKGAVEGYEKAMRSVARSQNDEELTRLQSDLSRMSGMVRNGAWTDVETLAELLIVGIARVRARGAAVPGAPTEVYVRIGGLIEEVREAAARKRPPIGRERTRLLHLVIEAAQDLAHASEALRYTAGEGLDD